jgi:hypothetical protein
MKKSFAFGEAVGLTPFAPFGDATRGRESPVRAGAPRAQPDGANGRRPAAPFGRACEGETAPRLLQNLTPPPA